MLREIGNGKIVENTVRKLVVALSTCLLLASLDATIVHAQNMRSEAAAHPRIVQAIRNLEDAIAYMEAAPDIFGGHKGAAIAPSRAAGTELRASPAVPAHHDRPY